MMLINISDSVEAGEGPSRASNKARVYSKAQTEFFCRYCDEAEVASSNYFCRYCGNFEETLNEKSLVTQKVDMMWSA